MKKAVEYIYDIPKFSKKCSLDNTRDMLRRLGVGCEDSRIIHVAGTNGKGSVCAYLDSILREAGHTVGLFTSPHLVNMNERIRINGIDISDREFLDAYNRVRAVSQEMVTDGMSHPSFFEFLFGMAMTVFCKNKVEYIILETGLGGRLDATNAIFGVALSVITSIGLDHTDILGSTIRDIATEKAGIIKSNVPVLFKRTNDDVYDVVTETAAKLEAPVFCFEPHQVTDVRRQDKNIDFTLNNEYYDNIRFLISSSGLYQAENAGIAATAAAIIGISDENIVRSGLVKASWKGRMQELEHNMILDGAHNEDGMLRFIESVKADGSDRRYVMYSTVKDKHYEATIKLLCDSDLFEGYILVPLKDERGLDIHIMEQEFSKNTDRELIVLDNVSQGVFQSCMLRDMGYKIYITGSLYLAGEVLELRVE